MMIYTKQTVMVIMESQEKTTIELQIQSSTLIFTVTYIKEYVFYCCCILLLRIYGWVVVILVRLLGMSTCM